MRGGSIWSTLEIAPTADRGEIRRAYAARLKLTNPEDDAEGFQALRQAYETALAYADHRARFPDPVQDDDGDDEPEAGFDKTAHPAPGPAPPAPVRVDPVEAERLQRLSAHVDLCNRLGGLISGGAPSDQQQAALDAVLVSPAMDSVTVHGDTEAWLARALLQGGPNSDPLFGPVVDRFHWRDVAGSWDVPPVVDAVLARLKDIDAIAGLQSQNSFFRNAYQALMRPPSRLTHWQRLRLAAHGDRVRELLARLRAHYPSAIARLDPEAVAWWDRRLARRSGPLPALFWLAMAFAVVLGLSWVAGATAPRQAPVARLVTLQQEADGRSPDAANLVELCRLRSRLGVGLDRIAHDCNAALETDEAPLATLDGRALGRLRQDAPALALADYEAILARSPNDARALYGRGVARFRTHADGAAADIARANLIDPYVAAVFAAYGISPPADLVASSPAALKVTAPPPRPPMPVISVPRGTKVTPVSPKRRATPEEARRYFPPDMKRGQATGKVLLHCRVSQLGALADCIVWSDTAPDHGFADAALHIAGFFRFTPLLIDGKPDDRGTVDIPFEFGGKN